MRRRSAICTIISGLCLAASAATRPALAGMSVSPLKQEVTVKPGEVVKVTVTVWNGNEDGKAAPEEVSLQVMDVKATEEGVLLFPPAGTLPGSASKWISASRTQLNLEPNQSEQVTLTIVPPPTTPPGEYYAAVMVATAMKPSQTSGVNVQFRIASGIFVTIPGRTFAKQAKIERCELLWPEVPAPTAGQASAGEPAPATQPANRMPRISVLLHNTGQARFNGTGKVRIQDAAAREVFSAPLGSKRACVFGGDGRLFEAVLTKPLPAGKYTIKAEIDYESAWGKARQNLLIEILPAQAELLMVRSRRYQDGQAPIEVEPAKVSVTARAGATRSLALSVKNLGDTAVKGTAMAASSKGSAVDGWVTVAPGDLTIARAGRKTVAVRVQVPAGVAGGTYASAVILKVGSEGSPLLERVVPVEIEVQAER